MTTRNHCTFLTLSAERFQTKMTVSTNHHRPVGHLRRCDLTRLGVACSKCCSYVSASPESQNRDNY